MGGNFDGGIIPRRMRNSPVGGSFCNSLVGVLLILASVCATAGGQLLPADATYVLVVGLPGDLQSESTYTDQLQTWLDILGGIRPKQVITLSDNPESIRRPADAPTNMSMVFLPNSRSNFLAASSLIAGSTNPLVVVVWGHGGRQGSTPVFHVRGPRITPTDLSAFAEKAASLESHWIL